MGGGVGYADRYFHRESIFSLWLLYASLSVSVMVRYQGVGFKERLISVT